MNRMESVDIAWLAGLIEGEAAIGAWTCNQNRQGSSRETKYARVEISSVDSDIIKRLHTLTGIGNIHQQIAANTKGNNKACTTWRVGKAEDIIHLLCTVASYGYFSEHRRCQILVATEAASEIVKRKQSGESYKRKRS